MDTKVYILIIVVGLVGLVVSLRAQSKKKKSLKSKMEEDGCQNYVILTHVNGLPTAEGAQCAIKQFPDRLEFHPGGTKITLDNSKIAAIEIKTATEIQNQAVSSIGGSVAGAVLLGPLGAIIGGRVKTKKVKTTTNYLLVTYIKNGEAKLLAFESGTQYYQAKNFCEKCQQNVGAQNTKVEL